MKQLPLIILLMFGLGSTTVLAHHLGQEIDWTNLREWTLKDGTRHVGSFLFVKSDKVEIEDPTGEILSLPLLSLSQKDIEYAQLRSAKLQELNTPAITTSNHPGPRFLVLLLLASLVGLLYLSRSRSDIARIAAVAGVVLFVSLTVGLRNQARTNAQPALANAFVKFAPKVKTRWDDRFLYVESDGLPEHQMMVGIRSWQQQVPLPQPYQGNNAWTIPLKPVLASQPISAKNALYRGAIALAVNGVPIFNALNNRGEDAYLAGELDEWGGHCGRADDYHYHTAPLHLQQKTGVNQPVAIALDGFPLYGITEPDGSPARPLDEFNGHADKADVYHYHATKTFPYINGGMRGNVIVREDQVDPQPRAAPVREFLQPLRGAVITGFKTVSPQSWELTYRVRSVEQRVSYSIDGNGKAVFHFIGPDGKERSEVYQRREGGRRNPPPAAEPRNNRQDSEAQRDKPRRNPDGPGGRRQPWIIVHAQELDLDHDGIITWDEVRREIQANFEEFDRNHDGKLAESETSNARGIRHPLAGFISQHSSELDLDGDGLISLDELTRNIKRMFDRADSNHDGRITSEELSADR